MPVLLAALLFQVQDLRPAAKACPYTLVTTAGERLGTLDRPNHDGKPVKFRLCTNGTLTMFAAGDVNWAATEQANASGPAPAPTTGLAPAPTKASLSGFAKQTSLRDAESAVRQNQTLSGKMKLGGREIALDDSAPFFGKESVAQHLQLSAFYADAGGCPAQRARAYGTVKNISRMKLRGLKALVLIGSLKSGDYNGQVQSMDPSDLVPGKSPRSSCGFRATGPGSPPRFARGTTASSSSSPTSRDAPRRSRGPTARTRSRRRPPRRPPPRLALRRRRRHTAALR